MDKNLERFIKDLKTSHQTDTQIFGNHFNEEKYNYVIRIMNDGSNITEDEWEKILTNYETDPVVNRAIIQSPDVPDYTKSCVVAALISSKLAGTPFGYEKGMVREILENYHNIEDFQLESMYNNFHNEIMQPISHQAHDGYDPGYPQHTIDRLIKMELEVFNNERVKPSGYRDKQHCFSHAKSDKMYEHIKSKMPKDAGLAEKVATSIINCPYFGDDKKNETFNEYGCNPDSLTKSTPEISNALYESAVYAAYDMNEPGSMSGYTFHMIVSKARQTLNTMVRYDLLSEALEYDLVSRAIEDAGKDKTKKMNDMLRTILNKTTSPKVLHLIYTSAPHVNDRDDACRNEHISDEDLKSQVKLYCDKIQKKVKNNRVDEVSDKWLLEIYRMMNRIPLTDKQYETILHANPTQTIVQVLTADTTPNHIIDKIIDILKEMKEQDEKRIWTELLTKAEITKETRNLGFTSKKLPEYAIYIFSATERAFSSDETCRTSYMSIGRLIKEPEFAEKISGIISRSIDKSGWTPQKGDVETYKSELEKAINEERVSRESEKKSGKELKEMTYYEIISAKEAGINELGKYIRKNSPKQYTELQLLANKHVELDDEYNTRDIQKEAMNTLDL